MWECVGRCEIKWPGIQWKTCWEHTHLKEILNFILLSKFNYPASPIHVHFMSFYKWILKIVGEQKYEFHFSPHTVKDRLIQMLEQKWKCGGMYVLWWALQFSLLNFHYCLSIWHHFTMLILTLKDNFQWWMFKKEHNL